MTINKRENQYKKHDKDACIIKKMTYDKRHYFVTFFIALLSCIVIARLMYLQLFDKEFLEYQGNQRSVRYIEEPASRGVIFDRNDQILAVSTPVTSIWVEPEELNYDRPTIKKLADLLGLSPSNLQKKIEKNSQRNFLYIKRHLSPDKAQAILNHKLKGVHGIREYGRYYPSGAIVTQLIGITNVDDKGQSGLENVYDNWLSGTSGKERLVHDLYGRTIDRIEVVKSAIQGKALYLSLDMRLQYLAYHVLRQAIDQRKASAGSVVMLDPNTGEVLALVNLPSYNPNRRELYTPDAARNRALTDQYEPGSTMKAFTVAAGLQSGLFTPKSIIDTAPGYIRVNGYQVKDIRNFGALPLPDVLKKSSNIGASKIAFKIGQNALTNLLRRCGFGQATGSLFPGESLGYVPFNKISKIGLANLSFGYHISVTPMQLARAYAVLANGGVLYPVSLLKQQKKPKGERVLSRKIAGEVVHMLKTVVADGTGRRAAIIGYDVAGKTGTSHIANKGRYSNQYYSSFIGMVPAEHPRLVMLVLLDNVTKGSHFGGVAAAPVFGQIANTAMRIIDTAPRQLGHS